MRRDIAVGEMIAAGLSIGVPPSEERPMANMSIAPVFRIVHPLATGLLSDPMQRLFPGLRVFGYV